MRRTRKHNKSHYYLTASDSEDNMSVTVRRANGRDSPNVNGTGSEHYGVLAQAAGS